jgi:ethanolamine utilization microcompartment shell protein EutL
MMFEMTLIKLDDWEWGDDYSYMRTLTCVNHPTARYLTKNPFFRSIGIIAAPVDEGIERTATGECVCPFSDLRVIKESSQPYGTTWRSVK